MNLEKSWFNYLKDSFTNITGEIPWIFINPHCGTCSHWFLIDQDGLRHLAATSSPREYKEILKHLDGKRVCTIHDEEYSDIYSDFRFYGWCRRFPPIHRQSYSIIRFRSLFSLLSDNVARKISEYDFPLMPHDCSCGEWLKEKWVDNFVNENKRNV